MAVWAALVRLQILTMEGIEDERMAFFTSKTDLGQKPWIFLGGSRGDISLCLVGHHFYNCDGAR